MFNLKFVLIVLLSVFVNSSFASTKTLEERVAELEANQTVNIFNFSGFLSTRFDHIDAKQTTPSTTAFEGHTQHWRLKSGFNINANISPKTKFYSTFAVSKKFNKWNSKTNGSGTAAIYLSELEESRGNNGSQVYLEKAYADYSISDSTVFSFGRLPTVDGPPSNLPMGKARMGTYPSMGYNATFDGMALSYKKPINEEQNLSLRLLYTPFTYYTNSQGKMFDPPNGLSNVVINNNRINSETRMFAEMLEYSIKNTFIAQEFSLIYFMYQTENLAIDGSDFNAGSGAGSGLINLKFSAEVLLAQLEKVAGSDLDLALTVLMSKVQNRGIVTVPGAGTIYGFGATYEEETLAGSSLLLSARYKMDNFYVGGEYLKGGKNVFNYSPAAEYLTSFYNTAGTGIHLYTLYKIAPELGLRFGYVEQKYDNTPFTFGPVASTDRKITTVYSELRLDF